MKWYIASRTKHKETINKIIKILEQNNQSITYDWTNIPNLIPYLENSEESAKISEKIVKAIQNTDIFILISDVAGTDMFIELGTALSMWQYQEDKKVKNKIKIYVIGKYNKRTMMHFHPAIIHVKTIKEIFEKECTFIKEKIPEIN